MTPKELMLKHNYCVHVTKHTKAPNVILVKYPKNIFTDPKLVETNIQYYLESDQILVTNLDTKNTGKIQSTPIEHRVLVVIDIIARALKRHIPIDLIKAKHKSKKILHLMKLDIKYKKEEKKLLQIFANVVREEKLVYPEYKEFYDKLMHIFKIGGTI